MSYLVDASVLSEATRPNPETRVVEWLQEHEAELVVDPIILGEVRFGILLLSKGRRRDRLEQWFKIGTGEKWAELLARLRATGRAMPIKDSLIAATALHHDLIVVTRKVTDFEKAGVEIVNPFEVD